MKGIKDFVEALGNEENVELRKGFEALKDQNDAKEVVEFAKKNGYEFTEDEYMDLKMEAVSGGRISIGSIWGGIKKGYKYLDQFWTSGPVKQIRSGIDKFLKS